MSKRPYLQSFHLLLIVVLFQCREVQGVYQLEYTIEVDVNGSALWIIEQKGIGLQASFERFLENVSSLLKAAKTKTQRNMSVTTQRFLMEKASGSYVVVRYQFRWNGFGEVEDSRIKIGDVFEVENFFSYLYGDGAVYVKYPREYVVESVSPLPHKQNSSVLMLEWYGIEDFGIGQPEIVFKEKTGSKGLFNLISENSILIIGLLALVSGGWVSFFYFKFRKREMKKDVSPKLFGVQRPFGIEDDEEKVVNLLRAAGGCLYQSVIAVQCGFSRSKTSKLLKVMEDKGKIKREQKGRRKVVTLFEQV